MPCYRIGGSGKTGWKGWKSDHRQGMGFAYVKRPIANWMRAGFKMACPA